MTNQGVSVQLRDHVGRVLERLIDPPTRSGGQHWKPDRSHPEPRYCYTCYLRRTGGSPDCDQPYISQERLETDLLSVLRVIALPEELAEEVDKALAASLTEDPAESRQSTLAAIESRLARLAELYELNDISREDYLARREELRTSGRPPRPPGRNPFSRGSGPCWRLWSMTGST